MLIGYILNFEHDVLTRCKRIPSIVMVMARNEHHLHCIKDADFAHQSTGGWLKNGRPRWGFDQKNGIYHWNILRAKQSHGNSIKLAQFLGDSSLVLD